MFYFLFIQQIGCGGSNSKNNQKSDDTSTQDTTIEPSVEVQPVKRRRQCRKQKGRHRQSEPNVARKLLHPELLLSIAKL